MKIKLPLLLGLGLSPLVFDACIDNNYDLDNVDTDVSFAIHELVIPMNLDAIKLKSVIDIEDGDAVQVVDGQYAALLKGKISSSDVGVPRFVIPKPADESKQITTSAQAGVLSPLRSDAPILSATIAASDASADIKLAATDIDAAIQSIDTIGFKSTIQVTIQALNLSYLIDGFSLEGLELRLPAHCKVSVSDQGVYEERTGRVTFPESLVVEGTQKVLTVELSELQADQAGVRLINGSFSYNSVCQASGVLAIYRSQLKPGVSESTLAAMRSLTYRYGVVFEDDIAVDSFSGDVAYAYPDMHVAPILLDELPDVLSQPGTHVEIENPQIYFSVNNPLAGSGVNPELELSLDPVPSSQEDFEVAVQAYGEQNSFCLSPTKPVTYYKDNEVDYSQAVYQPFSNLGKVLAGDGLPSQINVEVETGVNQRVSNFQLGAVGCIEGTYTFFAPLALSPGSEICYTDTIADWNDEDVDAMTIEHLRLSAQVVKDIPYAIELSVLPIDVHGNVINDIVATATLGAETDQPIPLEVEVTGDITHLDGIILKARVKAEKAETLSEEMTLNVSELRLTVSGKSKDEL